MVEKTLSLKKLILICSLSLPDNKMIKSNCNEKYPTNLVTLPLHYFFFKMWLITLHYTKIVSSYSNECKVPRYIASLPSSTAEKIFARLGAKHAPMSFRSLGDRPEADFALTWKLFHDHADFFFCYFVW